MSERKITLDSKTAKTRGFLLSFNARHKTFCFLSMAVINTPRVKDRHTPKQTRRYSGHYENNVSVRHEDYRITVVQHII